MTPYVVMAGPPAMSFTWSTNPESGTPSFWYLLVVTDGRAERIGTFNDERIAHRVADLLARNGMVDAPLPEIPS